MGPLDSLRPNQLTDCEVPLAIVFWTDTDGINFIDMWSGAASAYQVVCGCRLAIYYFGSSHGGR
jgi:hypothetical protein